MSQTKQQAVAGSPRQRKDWELFWRIIAGLMVLIIAWVLWVLYQITPRSVVTPLAYANPIRPIGTHQSAGGAAAPATAPPAVAPPAPQTATEAKAAGAATDQAQTAVPASSNQAPTDVRASAVEKTEQQIQGVGLRLATEISMPTAAEQGGPKTPEGASGSAPAARAAGKQQP